MGEAVGTVPFAVGVRVGAVLGSAVGCNVGIVVVGAVLGSAVGCDDGVAVGTLVGFDEKDVSGAVPETTTLVAESPAAAMAAGEPAAVPANPPTAFVVMVQSFVPSTPPNEEPRMTSLSPIA